MTLRELLASKYRRIEENYFSDSDLPPSDFEKEYIAIRTKERRLYTDSIVIDLPNFTGETSLEKEWQIRAASLNGLNRYLGRRSNAKIMELGCGNGWMSNQIARHTSAEVLGVDINRTEVSQAARVFKETSNVTFLLGDISAIALFQKRFDVIILASSIQYFKDVKNLIDTLLKLLTDDGEIHIIDSPVYSSPQIQKARVRSEKYFKNINSNMEDFYFHHSWNSFQEFNVSIHYKPSIFSPVLKKFGVSVLPFPWLIIRKQNYAA